MVSEQNDELQALNQEPISSENTNTISRKKSRLQFTGFQLQINDLITWVPAKKKQKEKVILKGITASIPRGKMTAIIGPSGSGKTTFMNYLAGRQNESQTFKNYAHYYINNTEIQDVNKFKNIIGYVLQEDLIEARMTPKQVFRFYAHLRQNKGEHEKTNEEIEEQVEDMIQILGLEDCSDTIVGNSFIRGISGGQKKRVNIGIELIQNPNLLFLDEPTTGLDSTTAFEIMNTIQKLKERNITIISTVHAPSQKLLNLFDKVIILCDGFLIYEGTPSNISQRLQNLNFKPKKNQPPLEYFLEIIDKDDLRIQMLNDENQDEEKMDIEKAKKFEQELDKKYQERINHFVGVQRDETIENYKEYQLKNQISEDGSRLKEIEKLALTKNQKKNICTQFRILYWKGLKLLALDYSGNLFRAMFLIINSLILYLTFLDLGDIEDDPIIAYQTRGGLLAMLLINYTFVGLTNASAIFFPQKRIFQKDQQGKIYSKGVFFFTTLLNIYPFYLVFLFGVLAWFYFGTDLNKEKPIIFFWFWLIFTFFAFITGTLYGLLVGVLVDSQNDTNAIIPILILPILIVSGFFAQIKQMLWPLRILSYISIPKFGFQAAVINEFRNEEEYISPEACQIQGPARQQCNPFSFYDFYEKDLWLNIVLGFSLMAILISLILFMFYRKFRDKKANLENNNSLIEKYAFINKEPMKI